MKIRNILKRLCNPMGRMDAALWGDFGMQVFDVSSGTPRRILRIRKKNQITNDGRSALLNLMGIGDATLPIPWATVQSENRIWSLSVGTNATPPTVADDAATMADVWSSQFVFPAECQIITSPPNNYYLAISKSLAIGDANGNTLAEAGIFTRGDADDPGISVGKSLYARQIHSPIIKTSSMTIQYDWQLGITIA